MLDAVTQRLVDALKGSRIAASIVQEADTAQAQRRQEALARLEAAIAEEEATMVALNQRLAEREAALEKHDRRRQQLLLDVVQARDARTHASDRLSHARTAAEGDLVRCCPREIHAFIDAMEAEKARVSAKYRWAPAVAPRATWSTTKRLSAGIISNQGSIDEVVAACQAAIVEARALIYRRCDVPAELAKLRLGIPAFRDALVPEAQ